MNKKWCSSSDDRDGDRGRALTETGSDLKPQKEANYFLIFPLLGHVIATPYTSVRWEGDCQSIVN